MRDAVSQLIGGSGDATPSAAARAATSTAIRGAMAARSSTGGNKPACPWRSAAASPASAVAVTNIVSVTRVAPAAIAARPTAGKMKGLERAVRRDRAIVIGLNQLDAGVASLGPTTRWEISPVRGRGMSRSLFAQLMNATDALGLDIPDIGIVGIATAYGIPAGRADSLADLTNLAREALSGNGPRLEEIKQRPRSRS